MDRVQFDKVGKKYLVGARRNAREALAAGVRRLAIRQRDPAREIWSLQDVTFSVADGEAVGIVGRNGAGKSTALKILTGITTPTTGVSRTRGRVASLLEVGTGFHSELTGRENVFLNGAILGMTRRDITRAFDQIVDFAGVERFLDTPVKHYSSGMQLRLGFAVAAHLEPDVLVVDEILAVGDAEFQRKCVGRMEEAGSEGRTLIFVSHDLAILSRLCPRGLWLEGGRLRDSGPSRDIVREYLASGLVATESGRTLVSGGPVSVRRVRVRRANGEEHVALLREDEIVIEVDFDLAEEVAGLDLAIYVTTRNGVRILDEMLSDHTESRLPAGSHCASMTVPPLLNVGGFAVGVWFGAAHHQYLDEPAAATFELYGSDAGRPSRVIVAGLPISVQSAPGRA